jgi:hypothetical protein
VGTMLGYPECCRRFFRRYCIEESGRDPTWPMAASKLPEGSSRMVEVRRRASSNIFWRCMSVGEVPHWPCSFACEATAELANKFRELICGAEEQRVLGWRDEVLSWPLEWSALHGIAEMRTPILKIVMQTESTAGKYVVRWYGSSYPAEGANGLRFPYETQSRELIQVRPAE